jgi:chromosome segregation ATPase
MQLKTEHLVCRRDPKSAFLFIPSSATIESLCHVYVYLHLYIRMVVNPTSNPAISPGPSKMSVRDRRAIFEGGGISSYVAGSRTENSTSSNNHHQGHRKPFTNLSSNTPFPSQAKRSDLGKVPLSKTPKGTAGGGDNVENLKSEILTLQQHVKVYNAERQEQRLVCKKVSSKEGEEVLLSDVHDVHLQNLNQKLLQIQSGLCEIEKERCNLQHRALRLEEEKGALQTELLHREKEIDMLQKRCHTTDGKILEAIQLRSQNHELSATVLELKAEVKMSNQGADTVRDLQRQLRECEGARNDLMQRLQIVKHNHVGVCAELATCLAKVEKMAAERQEWECERQRLQQNMEVQLEQQRIDHVYATTELQEKLIVREKKVQDLDRQLQDKISLVQRLRKQMISLEDNQADAMQRVSAEYEARLQLMTQSDISFTSLPNGEMADVDLQLSDKDAQIEALRNDMATQMQELMTATSELEKLQDDSKLLNSLIEDVEVLEHDCTMLQEILHERDTEIAELSAEILKLEIEKELAGQDTQRVCDLKDGLAAAVAQRESLQHQLEQHKVEASKTVTRLRAEIAQLHFTIRSDRANYHDNMDIARKHVATAEEDASSGFDTASQESIEFKDRVILNLQNQIEVLRTKLAAASEKSHDLAENKESIVSLQKEIDVIKTESKANEMKSNVTIQSYVQQVNSLKSLILSMEDLATERAKAYQGEIEQMTKCMDDLSRENANSHAKISEQARLLEESKSKLTHVQAASVAKIVALESEISRLFPSKSAKENDLTNESHISSVQVFQATIDKLNGEVSAYKSVIAEYEIILQDAEHLANVEDKLAIRDASFADLKRDLEFSKISLADAERKLDDQRAQRKALADVLETTSANEQSLLDECQVLRQQLDDCQCERNQLAEMVRSQTLNHDLMAAEDTIASQEQQMISLEEALQDRTTLLASMVDQNKDLQAKFDRIDLAFKKMEEESSLLHVQVQDKHCELERLREEWRQKEDCYLAELHKERNIREIVEADLEAKAKQLDGLRFDSKYLADLEKENQTLRDKIRRQEAYMKRKMEQDKVVRDRISGNAAKVACPPMSTPVRTPPTTVRKTPVAPVTINTRTTILEDSLDWELDTLLADSPLSKK